MQLRLNGDGFENHYPACLDMFEGSGSLMHIAAGLVAGSTLLTPQDAVISLAWFAGYQLSQAQSGEPFSRIGGELVEFALGMFLARLLPDVRALLEEQDAWPSWAD
jgi:hypothetical protein